MRQGRNTAKRTVGEAPSASASYAEVFSGAEPGRKGEILAAAFGVFAERGYSSGSMREIADRVGVSEPALYRHYSGKDALFMALVRIGGERVRDEGLSLIENVTPGRLRAQLVEAFADRRRAAQLYAPLLRTVITTASQSPAFLAEYRAIVIQPLRSALAEKAAELDVAYGMPDADATRDARVRALLALVAGYLVSSLLLGDEPDEAVADAVLRVMGWQETAATPLG